MKFVKIILTVITTILKCSLMNILLGQPFIFIPLYIGKIYGLKTDLSLFELEFLAMAIGCANWGMIYSYKFWFQKENKKMTEILNAQIKNTHLGYEDHCIFSFGLVLDVQDGGGVIVGGICLDTYNKETKKKRRHSVRHECNFQNLKSRRCRQLGRPKRKIYPY